jgi:hypothetical protein
VWLKPARLVLLYAVSITLNKRVCLQCGGLFESSSRTRKTCSDDCKRRYQSALKLARRPDYTCKQCGKIFNAWKRCPTFCSRDCSFAHKRANKVRRAELRREQANQPRICLMCNSAFTPKTIAARLCGQRECTLEYERRRAQACGRKEASVRPLRLCRECKTPFRAEYPSKSRTYCSQSCLDRRNNRINKATRRARMRGVNRQPLDPFDVFERDNWRCHLCGVRTPRNLRGTHNDRAPELDHILPLAVGGTHSHDNVACACRKCNQNKGAMPMGQMRLTLEALPKEYLKVPIHGEHV